MLCATTALVLGLAAPTLAQAQDAPALRYLDWNGRPEPVAMARAIPVASRDGVPALRPASPVIPHAGSQSMADVPQLRPATRTLPGPTIRPDGRPGLTPADAFFTPRATPAPTSPPVRTVAVETPPPAPAPLRQTPQPQAATPRPQPQPQPVPEPLRAPAASSQPAAPQPAPASARPAEWADDPNAPRADALIWSVGQPRAEAPPRPQAVQPQAPRPQASQPEVRQPSAAQPRPAEPAYRPAQGARYYSVHRQNGRQPDPTPMPEQVYLDALPIEMDQTPTSPNMAQPPEPPQLVRNPDGTVRRTTGESSRSAASRQ